MEVGSASQEKAGVIARGWWWVMALPQKLMAIVVGFANKVKKLGKDDPRRVIHSIKVGLALSLVSLFYYYRPLYDGFGDAAMWAVLTVVVVFEFSVGATLSKGVNRGIATLVAGALGVGAHHLATLAGHQGEPILIGFLVFILAAAATFSRFFPGIKARYDYGVMIFILTFSLVSVSGYRIHKIIELAHQRLSTIVIGGSACMIVSIFVCPVWAGEDLHKLIALNMEKLADFLEGFGGEYFQSEEETAKTSDGDEVVSKKKDDKPFLKAYKTVLNTKPMEESLANFARWEPCHGRFRFRHPWKQYLKLGVLIRKCAYQVEALNACISSDVQAPAEFKNKIQEACTKMSMGAGKALRELATGIRTMTFPNTANAHLVDSLVAAEDLKTALETCILENTDLLHVIPAATVASLLVEIVACTETIAESVNELARIAKFKEVDPKVSPEKPHLLHRGAVKPVVDTGSSPDHVCITVDSTTLIPAEGAIKLPSEAMRGGRERLEV